MSNLYLIGMMGCGKSTLAKALSNETAKIYKDLDKEIENEEGCPIPEIFKLKGEDYFRKSETDILKKMSRQNNVIVACGGGVILNPENVSIMKNSGTVVYLQRNTENILKDIEISNRPLLKDGAKNLDEIYKKRKPLYEEAAHYIIDNNGEIKDSVKKITTCCASFFN